MAKVPQYTQDKLASSIMPVVVDNSAAQLTGHLKGNVDKIADTTFKLAAEKQKEVDAINAKIKNVNDTLTAYDRSIAIENEMYDIIEEEKANNINNPQLAVKNVETRGRELIATRMAELDNTTDIAVKEKMAGIITNSFRGKLSELHTWQVGQDTANAQGKIDSMNAKMKTLEIQDFFEKENLISREDVQERKPNPECYLKILEKLQIAPSSTLVVEDTNIGLIAAKAAGCKSLCYFDDSEIDTQFADYFVGSTKKEIVLDDPVNGFIDTFFN